MTEKMLLAPSEPTEASFCALVKTAIESRRTHYYRIRDEARIGSAFLFSVWHYAKLPENKSGRNNLANVVRLCDHLDLDLKACLAACKIKGDLFHIDKARATLLELSIPDLEFVIHQMKSDKATKIGINRIRQYLQYRRSVEEEKKESG
ncbi:MAG: hypothetical protein JWM46_718 [Candidatus Kaiserbacteria bacterium]|nr:hypothetical protein [Candidatus Kaiserbacteria bacterium]